MDETIGVKGGRQDRKRIVIITENKKKKLEDEHEELKELEKSVKKKQVFTFIKALPIAIGGEIIKTIYDTAMNKKKTDKEEENSKWRIKEYDGDISPKTPVEAEIEKIKKQRQKQKVVFTPTGERIIVYINIPEEVKYVEPSLIEKKEEIKPKEEKKEQEEKPKKFIITGIDTIKSDNTEKKESTTSKEKEKIPTEIKERIGKLKSRKLVEEYERKLKEIRYDLRQAIYEYNVLVDQEEAIVVKKDAEIVLEGLSELIEKVETLKSRMEISNFDQYDENYILYLIEGYFEDFKNKKIISEIKESPIYIMISEKLDELDKKKSDFKERIEQKKEALADKEADFEELKSKYYTIDQLNNKLIEFQKNQDRIQKEIEDKVANATTITEKVEYQFRGLNEQTRDLLRLMSFQMFLPGPMFARGLVASAAAHIYFMNNILNPNLEKKTYKVITVKDYGEDIRNSISEIDKSIDLLGKTSSQIDKLIEKIRNDYSDYFGVIKECDLMLSNLQRIKRDLREKEFEMQKIKEKQQKELEKNDAKVLTRGKYPVN